MNLRALSRISADESGPTAVEYALMLACLILVCIAGVNALGGANNILWERNTSMINEALAIQ